MPTPTYSFLNVKESLKSPNYFGISYTSPALKIPAGTPGQAVQDYQNFQNALNSSIQKNTASQAPSVKSASDYSKSAFAQKLGISTKDLENRAKTAGYDSTESYYNSGLWKNSSPSSTAYTSGSATSSPISSNLASSSDTGLAGDQYSLMTKQIEQDYKQAMGELGIEEEKINNMISGIKSDYSQNTQNIENQYTDTESTINQNLDESNAQYAQSKAEAENNTKGELGAARQAFNELMSRTNNLYGSAQNAYSEILGRQTSQSMAEARNTLSQTVNNINGAISRTQKYYNQQIVQLKKDKNTAINQATSDYEKSIRDADLAKSTLGLSKQGLIKNKSLQVEQARLTYQQQLKQIQADAEDAQLSYQKWAQARETALVKAQQTQNSLYQDALTEYITGLTKQNYKLTPSAYNDLWANQSGTFSENQVNPDDIIPLTTVAQNNASNDLENKVNTIANSNI